MKLVSTSTDLTMVEQAVLNRAIFSRFHHNRVYSKIHMNP